MIIYSKNLIVNTEDFPAISIIRSNVNYDKYSVVFQSKFDADANVSISGLEYNAAVKILEKITEGITNNKLYLKLEVEGI
nr:MAG TPA: hypothetical protein [Bacteriophage sp.]